MAAEPVHYSPKQVADALSASESSVKRWCDQGAIPTVRTSGGHRRISLDGLQAFSRASGRAVVSPEVLGLPKLLNQRIHAIPGNADESLTAFRVALARGDESRCRDLFRGAVGDGQRASFAAEKLITDAMRGIGDAWDCDELDPYQERRACGICTRLIDELRSTLPSISGVAPIAIGGSLSGDLYQLPTSLVELTLREQGWDATNIGCNLPPESFLQAAHDFQPKMVWLSVSTIDCLDDFVNQQNRLAEGLGSGVSLVVGGRVLTDDIRPRLKYTAFCDSMNHLAELSGMIAGA